MQFPIVFFQVKIYKILLACMYMYIKHRNLFVWP